MLQADLRLPESTLDIAERHRLRAPVDVEEALKDIGVPVERSVALPETVFGLLKNRGGGAFQIEIRPNERSEERFTLAYLLMHYIYHRGKIASMVVDAKSRREAEALGYPNDKRITSEEIDAAYDEALAYLTPDDLWKAAISISRDEMRLARDFQIPKSLARARLGW